jgi:hypothetical protein
MKKITLIRVFGILFLVTCAFIKVVHSPTCRLNDLDKRLDSLRTYHVYKPGGCGIFAFYISEYLDQHNLPYKIIYASWTKHTVPTHVLIELQLGTYIDPSGFKGYYYNYCFGFNQTEHTKADLINLIKTGNWNKSFDRKDTSIIKSILCN